jgi:chitinase
MVATPIVMAYFVSWAIYAPAYFVSDIPANELTHINYAFANIDSNGEITLGDVWADTQITFSNDIQSLSFAGNFNQLLVLKQNYPHLQTLISVGGWVYFSFLLFILIKN